MGISPLESGAWLVYYFWRGIPSCPWKLASWAAGADRPSLILRSFHPRPPRAPSSAMERFASPAKARPPLHSACPRKTRWSAFWARTSTPPLWHSFAAASSTWKATWPRASASRAGSRGAASASACWQSSPVRLPPWRASSRTRRKPRITSVFITTARTYRPILDPRMAGPRGADSVVSAGAPAVHRNALRFNGYPPDFRGATRWCAGTPQRPCAINCFGRVIPHAGSRRAGPVP